VLRVSTLYADTSASTAAYYTRYLTQADGEEPGQWTGRQAALLGLSGEVTTEDLQALLEGRDPGSGVSLGSPFVNRVTSSGRLVRAVAGFDATLSAPKSLSVWWALSGDDGLAECHDVAVRAVVDCVERFGSTTRVRSNGARLHPESQGLTVAVFRQTTSRLDDPQLHSHVVISSKVQTADGRWLALDARSLKGFQRALGGLYQSVLRAELTARYGVVFGEIVKGQAEIAGMPEGLLEEFSKRSVQVERAYQRLLADFYAREGRDPISKEDGAMRRQAAADTRGHKSGHGAGDLRSRWLAEAATVGVTAETLADSIRTAAVDRPEVDQSVTVGEVIATVAEQRSAWHRFDVLQAICDIARPQPAVDGAQWAHMLHEVTDTVLAECVDLDPVDSMTRRRGSDGRSVWIEPSARHHTSSEVLAQEEHIICWAMDAQLDPPAPSTTVSTGRLDVMQAEAAAAVAGSDRLVLVVGPAGAGKTTMLAAAVDDLIAQGRVVFGVAPTAKAAGVLESETGMGSDTVAKLLHEWRRTDRPPEPTWRLPVGATVIVDEAGMIGTGDLHQLTHLADAHQWRLVLVGDPHQLQAVGRGGMFGELCATGRTIELDTIHRFHNQWEAAASLKLRHGDPGGLDAYLDHDRIFAAPFDEHVDNLAHYWAGARDRSEYVAITTTTNDHVDAINTAVHDHRRQLGQLGHHRLELSDGLEVAVGDVITTRRNERFLRTTMGESVRNRDYWSIDTIGADGSLSVTRIDGQGSVTLPAAYVAEHVQLGYAATEPGNQSDTATRSATLATTATTCRGLYVAVTRGQVENLVLVVTDSHDVADAVDVLEQVLASDRADRPATSVRRDLAATTPTPTSPAPVVEPRCEIPPWYEETYQVVHAEFLDALGRLRAEQAEEERVDQRINEFCVLLDELEPACQPHDDAIDAARSALDDAKQHRRQLERTINEGGWRERRNARREQPGAERDVTAAEHHLDQVTEHARPVLEQRARLRSERSDLVRDVRDFRTWRRQINNYYPTSELAEARHEALVSWKRWADGHTIAGDRLANTADTLSASDRPELRALAVPLTGWLTEQGLEARPRRTAQLARSSGIELDIGL
jgi:conjugative relaxase-like TrwC/TraI family protein